MKMIFIDTNKLLDFYRYKEENKEVLEALSSSSNIIISEQVIDEFERNRVSEIERLLYKINSKEASVNKNLFSIDPVGIFSDMIASLNSSNSKRLEQIKDSFDPLKKEVEKMLVDDTNDIVYTTFNNIITNKNTVILEHDSKAYELAVKRNRLGGVPRSDKSNFKYLTICDEYIWETILKNVHCDLIFITRDTTYLDNKKVLMNEFNKKTKHNIQFFEYISTALKELGEDISDEAISKEKHEQEDIGVVNRLCEMVGVSEKDIKAALLTLNLIEQEVLELRFGFVDGEFYTLEEVADRFNTSREVIRKIEARAIRKLKNKFAHAEIEQDIVSL